MADPNKPDYRKLGELFQAIGHQPVIGLAAKALSPGKAHNPGSI